MTTTGRTRRTSAEIRHLIVEAAQTLFAEKGYEATQTREIAERAGVGERLLYSNFGSKSELYTAAVVAPLADLLEDYASRWVDRPEDSTVEQRMERLIAGLYDFARMHRSTLRMAMTRSTADGNATGGDLVGQIAELIYKTAGMRDLDRILADYENIDAVALYYDLVAMAFGAALLDDLIIPRGRRRPGRARLLGEMNRAVVPSIASRRKA